MSAIVAPTRRRQRTTTPEPPHRAMSRREVRDAVAQTASRRHTARPSHRSRRSPPVGGLQLGNAYFAAIDGMRAIAILSVLVYHTGIYHNGLFGVDVFFVLSGYLITFTLLREYHKTGTLKMGQFYLRRAKRLLPLLLVTMLLTLLAVVAWGGSHELERFGQQAIASLVYLTNWEQIAVGQAYWDGFEALNPLGHMWSLAITEQFYLVWPVLMLVVLLVGRAISKRVSSRENAWQWSKLTALLVMSVGAVGLIASAVIPNLVYDGSNADRVYLGTDTHFSGLVAGAVAASITYLMLQSRARREASPGYISKGPSVFADGVKTVLVTVSSVVLLALIVIFSLQATTYEAAWLFQYGFVTVAILASLLVLTLTSPHNLVAKVFAWKPLVELGKVSYTLFLIHMPLYWVIMRTGDWNAWDLLILGVPVSILVACGLHHLVAEPLRMRPWRRGGATFWATLALTTASVLVVPTVVTAMPKGAGSTTVLTLGDSLANDFAGALAANAGEHFTVVDGGLPGCGISGASGQQAANGITQGAPTGCANWVERWQKHIDSAKPDAIVVNIAWDAVTQIFGEVRTDVLDSAFAATYRAELVRMVELLDGTGASVHIANSRLHNAVVTPAQAVAFNGILADVLASYPTIQLLDLQAQVCSTEDCTTETTTGEKMYLDNRVHFSDAGKREIAPWLTASIQNALPAVAGR
ncbi:acyltransferase family protein [Microbacterium sp.]|uniref:acyltransferase family protein n=1 Tax=Microbacterium sp. TaxID=51671 RepID=UPI003F6FA46E